MDAGVPLPSPLMPWLSPHDLSMRWRRRLWIASGLLLGLIVVSLTDRWLFFQLRSANLSRLEGKDWYRMLRVMGYLPTWLCIGGAVLGADWARRQRPPEAGARSATGLVGSPWWSRGVLLMLSPSLGGLAAEVLKMVFGRRRPINNGGVEGAYVWDGPTAILGHHDGGYGLPSSHGGVALAAAFIVWRLWPGAGPLALAVALGCGWTRTLAGAHFVSDIYVAGIVSYAVTAWLWAMHRRER